MASINETGHAKNVANFEDLISFCTGYGAAYNPSKNNIKLTALAVLLSSARANLIAVNNALSVYNNAVNARAAAFIPLKKLTTKILNALDATDAQSQTVADARSLVRKIQGRRASAFIEPVVVVPGADPVEPSVKSISASQLSYDNQIENFSRLVTMLQGEVLYIPNENDLKVTTLSSLVVSLRALNTAVINTTTPLSNSRIARNKTLYGVDSGLCDTALEVKKYVKSVFGATSPEYRQISKLAFKKIK